MATASGSYLEDIITCSLCYEVFNHFERAPKALPCTHNFCLECLEKFVKDRVDFKLPCPLCQAKFIVPEEGVTAIPTNITVKQLLDNLPPPSTNRKVTSSARCQVHKKEGCEFMCTTCSVPLCHDCMKNITKGPHATHTLDDVKDAVASWERVFHQYHETRRKIRLESKAAYETVRCEINMFMDENTAKAEERAEKVIAEAMAWKTNTVKKIAAACEEAKRNLQQQEDAQITLQEDINEVIKTIEGNLDALDMVNMPRRMDDLKKILEEYQNGIPKTCNIAIGQLSEKYAVELGEFNPAVFHKGKCFHFEMSPRFTENTFILLHYYSMMFDTKSN